MLNPLIRFGMRALAGVVGLVVLLCLVAYIGGEMSLRHRYPLPSHPPFVVRTTTDSAVLERGRRLAGPLGKCVDCHGPSLAGNTFIDNPAFGRYSGVNLTAGAGGVGKSLSDADWELAIRHGIDREGRGLVFMPSRNFNRLSDDDLNALILYIRQVHPVDTVMPPIRVGLVGRALLATGKAPLIDAALIDQQQPHVAAPLEGPTAEYGAYLARVGSCLGCHRSNLEGGPVAGAPRTFKPAANLTPMGIGTWTKADFTRALRDGLAPGGVPIDSFMPVRLTKQMTDTELDAIWAYLKTVPPQPMGK